MRFSFSQKLLVLLAFPLIIISVIVASISTNILEENLNAEIQKELRIAADSLKATYESLYEGDYSSDLTGTLMKGDTKISGDLTLVNAIKDSVSLESTFCYDGVVRLTTLRLPTGAPAVGVKLDKDLYEQIKNGEPIFISDYEFLKNHYYGYFTPLINSDGTVAGCIFICRPAEDVSSQISSELYKIVAPTALIAIVFLILVMIFSRRISGKMVTTKKFLEHVADGHLVKDGKVKSVKSKDEIGDIYKMSETLQSELYKIVSNIKESTDGLLESSNGLVDISGGATQDVGELKKSMEDIARDAAEQADKTAESVENLYNISAQIESISNEMADMYENVNAVSAAEKDASEIMEELNDANQEMLYTIGRIAEQINITSNSVQQIQQTIDMIRNIADETDLLAMNASIEAAHAGSAGRGFAVIAEQISKLASMSANNAGEVEKTLFGIREETEKMVELMDETKRQMDNQASKMRETVERFEHVAEGVENSLTNVESVNASMDTLDIAKETILNRVRRLADISQQFVVATDAMMANTNNMNERMKEMEHTATRLEEISMNLSDGLDNFKL